MIYRWHRGVGPLRCCSLSLVINIQLELDFVRSFVDGVSLLRDYVLISLLAAIPSTSRINRVSLLDPTILNKLALFSRLIRKLRLIVFYWV